VLPAPPLGGAPRLRPFARTRPHEAVKCEWTSETLGIGLLVGRPLAGSAISFGVLPLVEPARERERTRRAAYTSFGPESYERFTSGSCPPSPESPVVPPGLRGGAFAPPAHPGASIRFPVRRAFARPFSPASRVRVGGRTRNRSALAHLCRIAVRADVSSTRGFSWPGEGELPNRMSSPLRDGGVYNPDPPVPGVLLISTSPSGGGILTACPSATPLGLALGPD